MSALEIRWEDKEPKGKTVIHVCHHMSGMDIKIMMAAIEIQLAHEAAEIVIHTSSDGASMWHGDITYHMTPEQARKVWQSLDGYTYDAQVEFETWGSFWSREQEILYLTKRLLLGE